MKVDQKLFSKPLPRFLLAADMGRVFVIHTQAPRFIAEAIKGSEPLSEAALGYRAIDDVAKWAAEQPEGSEAAMTKLMQEVGDFYVAHLDRQHSLMNN